MKKGDDIIINGKHFKVMGFIEEQFILNTLNLDECYARPSMRKSNIYCNWMLWALRSCVHYMGIYSYNVHVFTMKGIIHDEDNSIHGIIYITPTRQEFYPFINYSLPSKHEEFSI